MPTTRLAALAVALAATCLGPLIAITSSGCRSVPVTGRRQIANPLMSEAKENQMGVTAYREMMGEETMSSNAEAAAMVERVGRRIAAVSGRDDFDWEFKLVASPTKNAFCLPGGKVAVYEGILPICGNEAGLAVVMSHEIGHAIARHGGERMNHQMLKNGAGAVAKMALGKYSKLEEQTNQMILAYGGKAADVGAILPFSRKHELEADAIGLKLMAEAGYDPSEAPLFWERFSDPGSGKPPEFLSTHPSDARRAAELRQQLPASVAIYKAAATQYGLGEAIPDVQLASGTDAVKTAVVPAN